LYINIKMVLNKLNIDINVLSINENDEIISYKKTNKEFLIHLHKIIKPYTDGKCVSILNISYCKINKKNIVILFKNFKNKQRHKKFEYTLKLKNDTLSNQLIRYNNFIKAFN